jgi:hypothetical protein
MGQRWAIFQRLNGFNHYGCLHLFFWFHTVEVKLLMALKLHDIYIKIVFKQSAPVATVFRTQILGWRKWQPIPTGLVFDWSWLTLVCNQDTEIESPAKIFPHQEWKPKRTFRSSVYLAETMYDCALRKNGRSFALFSEYAVFVMVRVHWQLFW